MRKALEAAAATIACAFVFAYFGFGSFGQTVAALFLSIVACIIGFIVALVHLGKRERPPARAVQLLVVAALSGPLSLPIGRWYYDRSLAEAQKFCESVIPRLEAARQRDGQYPREIRVADPPRFIRVAARYQRVNLRTVLTDLFGGRLPRLREPDTEFPLVWSADGRTFRIAFPDVNREIGAWVYRSDRRQWAFEVS